MSEQYNSNSIEVLNGLDPVRHRPGMYTETNRPNHLAQEVIDNRVDEALAGYADTIQVILYEDQSVEVIDNESLKTKSQKIDFVKGVMQAVLEKTGAIPAKERVEPTLNEPVQEKKRDKSKTVER